MKKMLLVFVATIMAFGFSAFAPQETNVDNFWYRNDQGIPTLYEGATECEMPTTPVCNVEIEGTPRRLYYDQLLTSPVPGRD